MALEVNRIPLSDKEPKDNGPKNKCNDCKLSNTTSLQMFKKMTLEFLTYKEHNYGQFMEKLTDFKFQPNKKIQISVY